jgi:hypothetical protein
LTLRGLLRKTKRVFWICSGLGIAAHISLSQIGGFGAEQKVVKPLTTQFVKRQPRLTKPLELKKRPQPKRRQVRREMVAVKARGATQEARTTIPGLDVAGNLSCPRVEMPRSTGLTTGFVEPQALAQTVQGSKESQYTLDMSLELMDLSALDTGRYHAMVVQDPQDKRNVKGFCRLAIVPPITIERAVTWEPVYSFDNYVFPALPRLVAAMNEYTDIKTDVLGRIKLNDAELFKAPWLLFEHREHFKLDDATLRNLGEYMVSGGLVFAEGVDIAVWNAGLTALRNSLLDGLRTQGIAAVLERLPNSHPVYHCYFDFDGPPIGDDALGHHQNPVQWKVPKDYLDGIEVDGRLVAIYSQKAYTGAWVFFGRGQYAEWDAKRPLQFGVNTIVYALTQEGSITRRLMESVQ